MKLSRWSCVAHSTVRNLLGSTHFFPSEAYRWPAPSWSFWVSVSCNGINWTQWGLLFASFLVWVSFNWINGPSEAVVRAELWVGYSSFTLKGPCSQRWNHIVTDTVHLFSNSLIQRKKLSKKHTTHVSRIEICRRTRKTRFKKIPDFFSTNIFSMKFFCQHIFRKSFKDLEIFPL